MRDIGRESYLKRRDQLLMQDERIAKLEAENAELTEAWNTQGKVLIERKREIDKLQAEVKLQSDSADHWEDEAMNHMSQAAKLKADMQRIYDSCCDVDLIIDIAGAAVEGNDE